MNTWIIRARSLFPSPTEGSYKVGQVVTLSVVIHNKANVALAGNLYYRLGQNLNGEFRVPGPSTTVAVSSIAANTIFQQFIQYTIPSSCKPGLNYQLWIQVVPTTTNYPNLADTDINYSPIFTVKALSDACRLFAYSINASPVLYCNINHVTKTVTQTTAYGTTLTGLTATWSISPGATLKISGALQTKNVSTNSYTAPVVIDVYAEDGTTFTSYTVTISTSIRISGAGNPVLVLADSANYPVIYPNPCYVGQTVKVSIEISNNTGSGISDPVDYNGSQGDPDNAVVYVYRQDVYTSTWVAVPEATIVLDRPIYGRTLVDGSWITSYEVFSSSWTIGPYIPYGSTYGAITMKFIVSNGGSSYSDTTVQIYKRTPIITTLAYSETLKLFEGSRRYDGLCYLSLNNKLYCSWAKTNWDDPDNCGATGLPQVTMYEQDYPGSNYLFDQDATADGFDNVEWQLEFYVNNPVAQVIFQSLVIEAGKLYGGQITIDSIEYKTFKYDVVQEPFYDSSTYATTGISYEWELPWQPVWKNDKWYLSIKNATDTTKLIQSQKLNGMWLRITLRGPGGDPVFIRSVVTKIANKFN